MSLTHRSKLDGPKAERPPRGGPSEIRSGVLIRRLGVSLNPLRCTGGGKPPDKTASLPQLDIVPVNDSARLLDGILIITVFDIFSAPNATVVSDGVDAIFGHAATPELNRAALFK